MKNFATQKYAFILLCWSVAIPLAWSQVQTPLDIALRHIEQNHESWGLDDRDVAGMGVSYEYMSKHNGVSHIYFIQRHAGIDVYNALINVNVMPNGVVLYVGKRFIPGLAQKVNATQPSLTPWDAIQQAAAQLGYSGFANVRLLGKTGEYAYRYSGGTLSRSDIKVALKYQPLQDGSVKLAWDLDIDHPSDMDHWSLRIDAQTGLALDKMNWTISCQFDAQPYHNHDRECRSGAEKFTSVTKAMEKQNSSAFLSDGAVYNVFPLPVESPIHGSRQLVVNPADPIASPFGWHDVNGQGGPDFTYTRGNNTYSFLDANADETPDMDVIGGPTLQFDFPFNPDWEPGQMINASITNLFYLNNMMHDITYHYGFDEPAGNYQANNYGNGGTAGDHVNAMGQYGGSDPSGLNALNNANFSLSPDGSQGRMRMFYWNLGTRLLQVTSPATVAGFYNAGEAQFGPSVANQPVSGPVVIVNDGVANPYLTDGCEEPFANAGVLAGKIALIDRGGCFFEQKVLFAQQAGAIGAIICNFEDAVLIMSGTPAVNDPTIPSISIASSTCNQIRQFAGTTLEVTIAVPTNSGPEFLSGDFDNGVIAHEYGHGISSRLTGGPNTVGCLDGDEQMGEGWSDFFSLITTVKPGDQGGDRRGIGTYVQRQPVLGRGIRSYPYSTDMNENPFTYNDIVNESVPYGVGAVWCTMLWDLYWAFVDEYGWDENLIGGTGGNNMAIQLVMDGMKIQDCSPGFVEGRDAILAADMALFGGANQCLIWEVFARRGLGYLADQGSSASRADGKENFEPLPTCIQELKIKKTATDFIQPGDEITYTVHMINHKPETATNVVVTDELPSGVAFVPGSASHPVNVNGNIVSFELGDMDFEDEITISYKGVADPGLYSTRYYIEDAEESIFGEWASYASGNVTGSNFWEVQSLFFNSPSQAFFVENIATESQQNFQSLSPVLVQGAQPAMRFYHWYETQPGADGGYVEVSTDGESWETLGNRLFRNPYPAPIPYGTFTIPNISGFSGNSGGWIASYADMSDYAGQEILIRFRFGTDETIGGLGWFLDDIELMDILYYNSEACVSSDEGDLACASAPSRGTIVESQFPSSVSETGKGGLIFDVFPNPARGTLNIRLVQATASEISLRIMTLDGKEVMNWAGIPAAEALPLDVSRLPEGMYLVQLVTAGQSAVKKVVLK